MPETFPTAMFAFDDQEVDLERRTISGGVALSGEEDVIETDGGGRVFAEFSNGPLDERDAVLAWRAFGTRFGAGTEAIIVPFKDPLHQPYSTGSEDDLAYGDVPANTATAAAALRATSMPIRTVLPQPLKAGMWFSIEHPTKGWRAYNVTGVSGDVVSFLPPLREAVTLGTAIELLDPRCLMRVDGRPPRSLAIGSYGEAAVRFVEAP